MSSAGGRGAGRDGVASGNGAAAGGVPALATRMRERFGVHGRGQHERDRTHRRVRTAPAPWTCTTGPPLAVVAAVTAVAATAGPASS